MNKSRKASADRNSQPKASSSRRPSATSLHARPNTVQPKSHSPEKTPSLHNLADANDPLKMVSKAIDVAIPKTRFSLQDRGKETRAPSPRLKSFPTERVKKLESPPPFAPKPMAALIAQQNQDTGVVYMSPRPDNGQGDAVQNVNQPYPGTQAGQQQVAHQRQHQHQGLQHVHPHSDPSLLPQQVGNAQPHRPFVAHGEPKNPFPVLHRPVATASQPIQQVANNPVTTGEPSQPKKEEQSGAAEPDYDKQPVGGRNAVMYRKTVMGGKAPAQVSSDPSANYQNPCPAHGQMFYRNAMTPNPQNLQHPQQVYQQYQQNVMQQQMQAMQAMSYPQMRAIASQQMMPNQGMTSQQDMNQKNLVTEYPNAKAQLKSYNVEVVNPNQLYRTPHPSLPQIPQQMAVPQQTSMPQQMSVPQQMSMPQQMPVPQQMPMPQQMSMLQQMSVPHQPRQLYRNPVQGNMMQGEMPVNPQMSPEQNPNSQSNPQATQDKPESKKRKPLKFTVSMIRDQERLLAAMKQQGVPVDIMRRQFETLLNEQRKHLEYIERIQKDENANAEANRPTPAPRKRNKYQDEKPEWMIHLTPPRLSYTEIEKIHEQRRKEREAQQKQQQQKQQQQQQQSQQQQLQQQQLQQQQFQQQQLQQQHLQQQHLQQQQLQQQQQQEQHQGNGQVPVQMNPQSYQHWQQTAMQQRFQNPSNVSSQPYLVSGNPSEAAKAQYLAYQQAQRYNPHLQQHQLYRPPSQPNPEQVQSSNNAQTREDDRPSTGPTSLLKMRKYKHEIRPQKLNNGLQDPEAARKQLESQKLSAETKRGLEYLANLTTRKPLFKLNGMQERDEVEVEFQQRLVSSTYQPPAKRIGANGLENSRSPNNPPPQRYSSSRKIEEEFMREYPRQKQNNPRNVYSVQAERENGTVAGQQPQMSVQQQQYAQNPSGVIPYNNNPMVAREQVMPFKIEGTCPHNQHYQQMQQYYQNTKNLARNNGEGDVGAAQEVEMNKANYDHAGGDASENMNGGQPPDGKMPIQRAYYRHPSIHEARTIGGVKYLARRPDCLPNPQILAPETLIASRHVQPPMMI